MLQEIIVSPQEQILSLGIYQIEIFYNPFNEYWYYNIMTEGEYIIKGISLQIGATGFFGVTYMKDLPYICILDKNPEDKTTYNPYTELGNRLGLYLVTRE